MKRVLVAGVGNIFFGDDGFGVEVARRLAGRLPPRARVADFGIRAIHLAYELLTPLDLLIVVDCMSRGERPGTLYLVEPSSEPSAEIGNAHAMDVELVWATVRRLGGTLPSRLIVGCEPACLDPGIGLSECVAHVVPTAIDLVNELISQQEAS